MREWTFITNHGLVLAYLYYYPGSTAREMAAALHVTEWTVHKIISELEKEGYVRRQKVGRSNIYHVNSFLPLRHEIVRHSTVADLLKCLKILPKQGMTEKGSPSTMQPDF